MTTMLSRTREERVRTATRSRRSSCDRGGPTARRARSIAICHGVKSHSGYYLWAAEQFVAQGFAVYALDLHGRGKSDGERFYPREDGRTTSRTSTRSSTSRSRGSPGFRVTCSGTAPAG